MMDDNAGESVREVLAYSRPRTGELEGCAEVQVHTE